MKLISSLWWHLKKDPFNFMLLVLFIGVIFKVASIFPLTAIIVGVIIGLFILII